MTLSRWPHTPHLGQWYRHGKWFLADLQRAPGAWSTSLFQSWVSSGSMMTRMCETTGAFSSLTTLAFTQSSSSKEQICSPSHMFSQMQKASLFIELPSPCLVDFMPSLHCKTHSYFFPEPPMAALTHALLIRVRFIFTAAFLHKAAGLHRTLSVMHPWVGIQDRWRSVSGETGPLGDTPTVCRTYSTPSMAVGLNSPQKCPLLLFPFTL